MLTATQKSLVQESFATIAPIADDAAALFYRRLFEIDPSLRHMFRGDMAEQRRKLMQMLTAASERPQDCALKATWRPAITSTIVPMLQGAAVHTAIVAEQMSLESPNPDYS